MNQNQLNASAGSSDPSANIFDPVPQLSRTNRLLDGQNMHLIRDNPETQVIDPRF
jgi:hypothetical protein